VLWLDAASLVRRPLTRIENEIRERGGFFPIGGSSPVTRWTHPKTLELTGAPLEDFDRPTRAGAVIGLDPSREWARELLELWGRWVANPAVLDPPGATRENHRWDQSLWTLALENISRQSNVPLTQECVDISAPRPLPEIAVRARVHARLPRRLGALAHTWAEGRRAVDTRWHRALEATAFIRNAVNGASRVRREGFHLAVQRDAGPWLHHYAPRGTYWADPFLVAQGGKQWVFFEEFLWRRDKGHLSCAEVRSHSLGPVTPVLQRRYHLSYPCAFRHDGHLWMIPDSSANGTVDLYRCVDFPRGWRLERRLFHGLDAADTTPYFDGTRWWLFTSIRTRGADALNSRQLALYSTHDLLVGDLTPHPINGEARYAGDFHGTGRSAGPLYLDSSQRLIRPTQFNHTRYGERIRLMHVETLTRDGYEERPLLVRTAPPFSPPRSGTHHMCANGGMEVVDVRHR